MSTNVFFTVTASLLAWRVDRATMTSSLWFSRLLRGFATICMDCLSHQRGKTWQ